MNAATAPLPAPEALDRQVEAVLAEALYWFPLRHHSPTCAAVLERALRARRPRLVFLEAPAGLEPLVPALLAKDTRPPVAFYASWRDDAPRDPPEAPPRQLASWYPLLGYSPEYVALRVADELGAEVVFIDLPQAALLNLAEAPTAATPDGPPAFAAYCQRVAERAGWRHWNEAWDRLFEHGAIGVDAEDWRRQLATFCAVARACGGPLDAVTQARERHMARAIRDGLAARDLPPAAAMVVCGGFHLYLDRDDPTEPPAVPLGTEHRALVPYSYPRLSEQRGYAAGNRAPRWYERLHAAIRAGDPASALTEQAIEVLHRARRLGETVATADAISVQHHAALLAQLRGSALPVLDDLDDALLSCCVKGAPEDAGTRLARAAQEVHVGTRVGQVSASAGQLPLVRDYHAQLAALELAGRLAHEQVEWLQLDRRQPLDAARSAFLHRLCQLEVPLGTLERERHGLGHQLFGERWKLLWSTRIEAQLIERSLDGDRVETAALTAFARALAAAGHDAAATGRLLQSALAMALPGLFERAGAACAAALDADFRFVALVDALTTLRVIETSALAPAPRATVTGLIDRAFDRACFALSEIVAAPDEEHPAILDALKALAEAAISREDLDADHYASSVQQAAALTALPGLRGALLGLLVELQRLPLTPVAEELAAYAQASPERQLAAGDFLHGLLAVSGTRMLQGAGALVAALDALLARADREVFLAMLPRLRAAITQLHPRQRDALAAEVARLLGLAADEIDAPLATSAAAHALIAEIDREAAAILAGWGLA